MSDYIIDIPENYYITEYPTHWMVQISVDKKPLTKNFSFRKFGSKEESLLAAITYRDKMVEEHNIDLKSRFKKSTIPGVQKAFDRKSSGEKSAYWQAIWSENGKQGAKRFSVNKFGELNAKNKAIEYRNKIQSLLQESGQTLFEKPAAETKIWRYMDFTKFVYMLEKGGLFFPSIDSFNDPYEGSYSRGNLAIRKFVFSRAKKSNELEGLISKIKDIRPYIHANCWHMNDFESAGMWRLYSKTNESICIQTQFSKLEMALPENIKFGKVKYINYEKEWIPESDIYYPFIYKRLSFEHEKELRAIFNSEEDIASSIFEKSENGYWVKMNLQTLIQRIYVSPEAQDWFVELVEKIKNRYKLTLKRVYKSPLNNEPDMNEKRVGHIVL
jgi:hypothetical protein